MSETNSKRDKIIQELENLKRKTSLMQSCHGKLAEELSRIETLSTICITLFSGLALVATTAEVRTLAPFWTEVDLRRVAAFCSLSVFVVTLVKLELRWGSKAGMHRASLEAFTKFLRRFDMIIKAIEDKTDLEIETLSTNLANEYSDICEASPNIPNRKFLSLKQQHLRTIAVSRALDKDPFPSIREIKKQIKNSKTS